MKNYRNLERYQINEWEIDKEWLGKRLSFLWNVRKYRDELYTSNKLNLEVLNFYDMNDSKIMKIASDDFNYIDGKFYENMYKNKTEEEMMEDYEYLRNMKDTNFNKFILKKNCDKFEYLLITLF
jgi:hypothetical protein